MRMRRSEEGASLVEVGLVVPILILLSVGLAEIGFLVIDYITVTNAARSAARTGAAAASEPTTDTPILNVVEQAACNLRYSNLETVTIYKAEPDGSIPGDPTPDSDYVNKYQNDGGLNDLICTDAGSHALTPGTPCCDWTPADRIGSLPAPDSIGVRLEFSHESVTGIFPFPTTTWTETATMRLEPDTRGSQ